MRLQENTGGKEKDLSVSEKNWKLSNGNTRKIVIPGNAGQYYSIFLKKSQAEVKIGT